MNSIQNYGITNYQMGFKSKLGNKQTTKFTKKFIKMTSEEKKQFSMQTFLNSSKFPALIDAAFSPKIKTPLKK